MEEALLIKAPLKNPILL
jgi:hypothetical protein